MVKTIKQVKILGYKYDILYSPDVKSGGMESAGRCVLGKQLIIIDPGQVHQQQMSSILHEVIEALNYHLVLSLPHNVIMQLEAGLFQFICDNPEVFRKES